MIRERDRVQTLRLETLEQRELMAGNVWVGVENGLLRVVGDHLGNEVSITPTRNAGEFTVRGNSGTRVNGLLGQTFSGVSLGIQVHLGDGNDKVNVSRGSSSHRDVIPGPLGLGIDGGDGNDTIVVENVRVEHSCGISAGAGNDRVEVKGSYFGWDLIVDTSYGNDDVSIKNGTTAAHYLMIGTGDGDDSIDVNRAGAAWVYVVAGAGRDRLSVRYLHSALPPGFDLGAGVDPHPTFGTNYYPFHYLIGVN
ncbi:MAG: hypothetical protein AB7I30_09080 [Isosphaeraceae bacterium]